MATSNNITISLRSLVKNNGGKFKSEKQAKFLLDVTEGLWTHHDRHTFGEFSGCTRDVVTYFELNAEGVQKVSKVGSTGKVEIIWENTPEFHGAKAAKLAKMQERAAKKKAKAEADRARYNNYSAHIKPAYEELTALMAEIANEYADETIQKCIDKGIDEEMANSWRSISVDLVIGINPINEDGYVKLKKIVNESAIVRVDAQLKKIVDITAEAKSIYYGE